MFSNFNKMLKRGFSLVELLIVVAIIGILVATITVSFSDSRATARDAQRQSDLREIQIAIENYKRSNGQYPSSLQSLAPQFILEVPNDPADSAIEYSYRVNAQRSVFKLMARGTVESITVTPDHPMAPCDPSRCGAGTCANSIFQQSFAVWGGFASSGDDVDLTATNQVICANQ